MNRRTFSLPPSKVWPQRTIRALAYALLAVALASCTPNITAEFEADGTADVTAESRGAILIVRIPDERPREGVDVRRDGRPNIHVPPGHYPPPGECRIWHPNRPPGQQPPPGSCSALEQQVPEGAYLVYG